MLCNWNYSAFCFKCEYLAGGHVVL